MKGLTLTQPWATLVAAGAKAYETRSWSTSYRGLLAIHAAKGFPKDCRRLCAEEPYRSTLKLAGVEFVSPPPQHWYHVASYSYRGGLPLGAIVAVARLVNVQPTSRYESDPDFVASHEHTFGDYSAGRFAWRLANVVRLSEPIPCRGALGLWTVPEGVLAHLPLVAA